MRGTLDKRASGGGYAFEVARFWILFTFGLLFAPAASRAIAQGTDIVKVDQVGATTIYFGATLTPWFPTTLVENSKISGTRVEMSGKFNLYSTNGTLPAGIKSKDFKIELLSGSTQFTIVDLPDEVDGYATSKKFRFATTFAADGATINIRISGKVWMQPPGYSAAEWFAMSKTFPFEAYNKLQLLGTTVDGNKNEDQDFEIASTALLNSAKSNLAASHSSLPSAVSTALEQSKADFRAKVTECTVFAALAHGSTTQIWDSDATESTHFDDFWNSEAIELMVDAKGTTIPAYNLVGLWSCSVLAGNATEAPVAYEVSLQSNRALLGYAHEVQFRSFYPETFDQWYGYVPTSTTAETRLDFHADLFFDLISAGYSVKNAIAEANTQYPPGLQVGSNIVKQNMLIVGDPMTTLKYVHLTVSERSALGVTDSVYPYYFIVLS